jgi:uncharacterized membrane protein YuzA (DUF378 family)
MKGVHTLAFILVVIGGLNWGLVAIGSYIGSNLNLVNLLVGSWPQVEALVYLLVGLSAIALFMSHKGDYRACNPSGM